MTMSLLGPGERKPRKVRLLRNVTEEELEKHHVDVAPRFLQAASVSGFTVKRPWLNDL